MREGRGSTPAGRCPTIAAGTRLGPYEVGGLLGAGGMGEVYLAWDPRLEREVAIKVLPASLASEPDRVRRFEQEVRAAGALEHPNVLAVHDVGVHAGTPFIVMERLEGETLRARLERSEVPPRKAIEYATQVARGLAAAQARGIVHRDIKPENVFLCRDGTVKILDFGLAKLVAPETSGPEDVTVGVLTLPGSVMGTAGYMSPEQVRGLPVDGRSDIFTLGIVLYEMLAGRRPFSGETVAEIHAAILRDDPPGLASRAGQGSPAVDCLVRRCLEKRPEDRFDTAHDVALSLEAIASHTADTSASHVPPRRRSRARVLVLGGVLLLAGAALAAGLTALLRSPSPPPAYTQLTFRRGMVVNARFAEDGQTIVYSAAWNGQPPRVFTTRPGSPESRDLGIEGVVLAVSSKGEMAVRLSKAGEHGVPRAAGTLATVSLAGGAPRERLQDVVDADWDASGADLAVVRRADGRTWLEYPIGQVVYQPNGEGELNSVRVLQGGRMAVIERLPDAGVKPYAVSVVDKSGKRRVLPPRWADPGGGRTGWSPSGEIVFSAVEGTASPVYGLTLEGHLREVVRFPGEFFTHDVDRSGRMLLVRAFPRGGVMAKLAGEEQEHDQSWLDFSYATDISADGRRLLVDDFGGNFGETGGIVLRTAGEAPAVLLGTGTSLALSPDGQFVLALPLRAGSSDRLAIIPTGAGEHRELHHDSLPQVTTGAWFADGRRLAVVGGPDPQRCRVHVWAVDGGSPPRPISPEGLFESLAITPDGRWVAAVGPGRPVTLYASDGSGPQPLRGGTVDDQPLRWSADGRWLLVRSGRGTTARIERVEASTGRREPWKTLQPADPAGVFGVSGVTITPDGTHYAYTFASQLGNLYLAEGLK